MFVRLERALLISFFLLVVVVTCLLFAISLNCCLSLALNALHLLPDTLFFSDRELSILAST